MSLSFMSEQYWQNSYIAENDSVVIDASHWYLRVPHKFGIGILGGALGFGAGLGFGYLFRSLVIFYGLPPVAYIVGSSIGVDIVSQNYGNDVPYVILLLGGIGGFASGIGLGELLQEIIKNDHTIGPHLIGIIVMTLVGEIAFSEIEYNTEYDSEWDEYIYNESDKLVFHEYVKSTQVFNFELFRIQL